MAAPLGSAPGIMVGVGVGGAASAALEPLIEPGRQNAWDDHRNRVLDPGLVARLVAQGAIKLGAGSDQAGREGINSDRFRQLVYLAQRVPGLGELDRLSNRKLITPDQLADALNRHAYPGDWHRALIELMQDILTPGELAAAIHRGLVRDPGLLQGQQPSPPYKVDHYPVYPIDALEEAQGSGYNRDRLGVLVGLQGLPMGVIEAAHALYRGIITHGDYITAFNTSNSRNEWAEAVLEYARQIPTARDFFENALRGYHTLEWAQEQAQRHGMTPEDSLVIYQNQGRPMPVARIQRALARGGVFKPEPGEITDPFMASIVEGNLKPAYYDLAKTERWTMPSAFVMRQLAQSGVWDEAKTAERLKWLGWFPQDADEAAKAWAGDTTEAKVDARVRSAQTSAIGALHKRFMLEQTDEAGAINGLQQADVTAANADKIVGYWILERLWTEKPLTPANIKKAYKAGEIPQDEAVARLVDQQWSATDAQIYLTT